MVTGLSALTMLKRLDINFEFGFRPNRITRCSSPLTRAILPALTQFKFQGTNKYLEDLLARIDAPQLKSLEITFFYQDIFDIRQVVHHSQNVGSLHRAEVTIESDSISIKLCQSEGTDPSKNFNLIISDDVEESGWQISSLAQICSQCPSLLSGVADIEILLDSFISSDVDDFAVLDDPTEWLELFRSFTAVRTLWLSGEPQSDPVLSLQELRMESVMEMLPALRCLYFRRLPRDEYEEESIEQFFFVPELSGHVISSESAVSPSTTIYQP
ncbi:hypothetical protein BGW80DRAFT_1313743, partial [Lactifluus volemus]